MHQCNCQGAMGAGVAKQVRDRLLSPEQFRQYREYCLQRHAGLLGNVHWCLLPDGRRVANLFGQDRYGRDRRHTDYSAVRMALQNVERNCREHGIRTAAMPDHMGCSLGGGDWGYMLEQVIRPIFENSPVTLYICRFPGYGR